MWRAERPAIFQPGHQCDSADARREIGDSAIFDQAQSAAQPAIRWMFFGRSFHLFKSAQESGRRNTCVADGSKAPRMSVAQAA